jgi:hypothetical protein
MEMTMIASRSVGSAYRRSFPVHHHHDRRHHSVSTPSPGLTVAAEEVVEMATDEGTRIDEDVSDGAERLVVVRAAGGDGLFRRIVLADLVPERRVHRPVPLVHRQRPAPSPGQHHIHHHLHHHPRYVRT